MQRARAAGRGRATALAPLFVPAFLLAGSCSHDWSGSDGPTDGRDEPLEGETGGEVDGDGEADEEADEAGEAGAEAEDVDEVETVDEDGSDGPQDDGGALCGNGTLEDGEECDGDAPHDCVTGCGTVGQRSCVDCLWSHDCVLPIETCNGVDDDCDTVIDETFACTGTMIQSCGTTCGSTGSQPCTTLCTWGTCEPPIESCNALDDDCDGVTDDGFPCVRGVTTTCLNACGVRGTQTCTSDCSLPLVCCAVDEFCDCGMCDDDCDTLTDEIGCTPC